MKPISKVAQTTLNLLIADLKVGESKKVDNTDSAFMPVIVERLSATQYAVSHNYIQNGDVMCDPEIVFLVNETGAYPVRYRQDNLGIDRTLLVIEEGKVTGWIPAAYRDTASFCTVWMRNIKEQQGLKAAKKKKVA